MSAVPAIEARKLFKIFGREPERIARDLSRGAPAGEVAAAATVAVEDASLTVDRGELVVLAGLPGSGKSTLARMIGGVLAPTQGEVRVGGVDVHDDVVTDADGGGVVFGDLCVLPHLSVADNVAHGLDRLGVTGDLRRDRVDAALAAADLTGLAGAVTDEVDEVATAAVALARAFATTADVVLLDDPFSGLDPSMRLELQQRVLALRRELDHSVLFLTRDVDEAVLLGDRVAMMSEGRITRHGTADDVLAEAWRDELAPLVDDAETIGAPTAEDVVFADLEAAMLDRGDEPIVLTGPLAIR